MECGNPGIWKSMSSWILSRIVSLSVLSVLASWYTSGSSCIATVCLSGCPDLSYFALLNSETLSSDERVWISSVWTGRPVLSEELSSSLKELTLISWERDVFLPSFVLSGRPDLSRIGLGIGWAGWKKLCLSSNFSFWLSNSFLHALCRYCARHGTFKSIFSGSLWLLSIGSISRKNTVCLLLEFWPPGINPELMIEWRLNAHPIW